MIEAISNLLAAFGLSGSAGLNAYLPLLIVALTARFTSWIELASPWNTLENGWVIGALVVLLIVEFFADKIPAVNHANDVIQTVVRPAAGAILFAASANVVSDIHPVLAMILGLVVAGTVHVTKSAVVRPVVTATTGGTANPVVSLAEDVIAAVISILAVVLPVLMTCFLILLTAWVVFWLWQRANRERLAKA
jgi:hypothetical protein